MKHMLFPLIASLLPVIPATAAPIARIGTTEVADTEIRSLLDGLDEAQREAARKDPALLNQAIRAYLVQKLVLKEATDKKWQDRQEVVAQISRSRDSIITESYLRSVSQPESGFPSDDEVAKAYENAKDSLKLPRQFRLAQIFIAAPKAGDTQAQAKGEAEVEAVKKKLRQPGVDFAAIAREHSEEAESAGKGGEIGWLAENSIQPAILEKVEKPGKDGVTEVVKLPDGWHILKVLEKKEARTATLDEVKPQLVERLRQEKGRLESQAYLAKLLKENPVVINEIELSKLAETRQP